MTMEYVWFGVVGLVLGALAGQVLRGRFNFVADLVLGLLGSFVGGFVFLTYFTTWPNPKVGGLIFAALGAGIALLGWRALRSVD
jgi:uncharacterized membrane protein YeaQ/YmgE (transglycosylase-associated protein family)